MKQFIIKTLVFIVFIPVLLNLFSMYAVYTESYKKTTVAGIVYYALFKSKQKSKAKKLVLGDSVGDQFFRSAADNDTINSLTCNESVSMSGHFILLNNYLHAGNRPDTVYFILAPFCLQNNLDQYGTYNFFLKPFYTAEYKPLFTQTVNQQLDKIPCISLCRLPVVLNTNWAPEASWFTNQRAGEALPFLSPISIEYLNKIKELSLKNNFKLIILPTPLSLNKKAAVQKMNVESIGKNGFDEEFKTYFENIIYLNDTCFTDGVHLKDVAKYRSIYLDELMR